MTFRQWRAALFGPVLVGCTWAAAGLSTFPARGAGPAPAVARAGPRYAPHLGGVIRLLPGRAQADMAKSNNWSGYDQGILETRTPFTSVSGWWAVPRAAQHLRGQAEYSSTWLGIGGGCLDTSCTVTGSTLIQAGTEQDVSKKGVASYSAWWEVLPAPAVAAPLPVRPGDHIGGSISQVAPGLWRVTLVDATDRRRFSTTVPYASSEDTAEWILESPVVLGTGGAGEAALPSLGTVHFWGATTDGSAARLGRSQAIQEIAPNGVPLATPSAPLAGRSFNDCTYARTCGAP
jgi:hypothetical protein